MSQAIFDTLSRPYSSLEIVNKNMNLENLKQQAAISAVDFVQSGMVIGLGSGSTVYHALLEIGKRVQNGMDILGIPTSLQTARIAESLGIPLSDLDCHRNLDLTIDGADEIDTNLNLIKGLGGALVREKITAEASQQLIIIADQSKIVPYLGQVSPLPVEVVKFGWKATQDHISQFCTRVERRFEQSEVYITDNGNYILDCYFEKITQAAKTEVEVNSLPGVVENGLFIDRVKLAIIGTKHGIQHQYKS